MIFSFAPSPHPEVIVQQYDTALFPRFAVIFDDSLSAEKVLSMLRQPKDQAEFAIVVENRRELDITALRYRWLITDEDGRTRTHTSSGDSYYTQSGPVLKAHERMLVTRRTMVRESLLDHVLAGGGAVLGDAGSSRSDPPAKEIRFAIDTLVFADGELCGADVTRYAGELQCRKPAADFIIEQMELAEDEARDPLPVLRALYTAPYLRDDFLAYWVRQFAGDVLRRQDHPQLREATLRHLKNLPKLPKFFRR